MKKTLLYALISTAALEYSSQVAPADQKPEKIIDRQQLTNNWLLEAVQGGNLERCEQLLEKYNADPNCRNAQGRSALSIGLEHGPKNLLAIVQLLVAHGIDLGCGTHLPRDGYTIVGGAVPQTARYITDIMKNNDRSIKHFMAQLEARDQHFIPDEYPDGTEFLNWSLHGTNNNALEFALLHRMPPSFIADMISAGAHRSAVKKSGLVFQALKHGNCTTALLLMAHKAPININEIDILIARAFSLAPDTPGRDEFLAAMHEIGCILPTTRLLIGARTFEELTETCARALVLGSAVAARDVERVQALAPLCTRDNAINHRIEFLEMTPLEIACSGSSPDIVRCLREHGADARAKTPEGLPVWELARQKDNRDIVAEFADIVAENQEKILAQEDQKERASQARKKTHARPSPRKKEEVASGAEAAQAEEVASFEDPDGLWVIDGLAARRAQAAASGRNTPQSPELKRIHRGSPVQQLAGSPRERAVYTMSKYAYDSRVARWIDAPHEVFATDPVYQGCPEDRREKIILLHSACRAIDALTARCCVTETEEAQNVITALCPCLMIQQGAQPERRIFKCCADKDTRRIFHRFFHDEQQCPTLFERFHPLPSPDQRHQTGGAGAPLVVASDGSIGIRETEHYIHCRDPRHNMTIYFAKRID